MPPTPTSKARSGPEAKTRVIRQDRAPFDGPASAGSDELKVAWETNRKPPRPAAAEAPRPSGAGTDWLLDPAPAAGLRPRSGAHDRLGAPRGDRCVGITVFGTDARRLGKAIKQIEQLRKSGRDFIPIVLTDCPDHDILRQSGLVFEYFPATVFSGPAQVDAFNARMRALWNKWRMGFLIDMGRPGLLRSRLEDHESYFRAGLENRAPFDPRRDPEPPRHPSVTDVAALRAEYRTRGLDRMPDTYVLYRILGNDLPPRHDKGQTVANLRFILDNEPALARCEKRWIVNRIVDRGQEEAVIALLEENGQPFLHVPFDFDAYRAIDWDLQSFPQLTFFLNGQYSDMSPADQARAQAHSRRYKNGYVMNNNGARNAALRDGRSRAKWVLPWDGNCFLTRSAWAEIRTGVEAAPHLKYFTVPMARIGDNSGLLEAGARPEADDEPQILFRNDAAEEFDEERPYGRRPKVELLWRLGIPGPWDGWSDDVWDLPRPGPAAEAGEFGTTGWVARLHSGREDLEQSSKDALIGRGLARAAAINTIIDGVDRETLARGFDRTALTAYDEEAVDALKQAPADTARGLLRSRLIQEADLALQRGPYSVIDKTALPPSGDRQDYFHPSPYWWPDPDTASGSPMVYRDGLRAPGTQLFDPQSDRYDRTRAQGVFNDTTILALAQAAGGTAAHGRHAARLVRRWFIDAKTRMNPHLGFAQFVPDQARAEGTPSGIIEMKDLYFFLDAVRLLERSGFLDASDSDALSAWLREYLTWLQESPQGIAECKSANNHGTCFDLQIGAIAAYLGEVDLLSTVFRRSRERISGQFDGAGAQKHELKRTQTQHYCAFNLQAWVHLATLAAVCGDRLWDHSGADGRGLDTGIGWILAQQFGQDWPHPQISRFDADRFLPLVYAAQARLVPGSSTGAALGFARKPVFFPHDGIKPFWMLSRSLRPQSGAPANKTLAARVKKAELTVRETLEGPPPRRSWSARALEQRLWGGYAEQASRDLEGLKQRAGVDPGERANAVWALARWRAYCGRFDEALVNIRLARSLVEGPARHLTLAEAGFLIELGRPQAARDLIEGEMRRHPDDANLFLMMANGFIADPELDRSEAEERALEWINKVFLTRGLAAVGKRDPGAPLGIFNIEGANVRTMGVAPADGPKVSVVFPVFDGADTIAHAVNSIRAQSWRNLQIIVVDDCSTDDTCRIVEEIADRDPRVELLRLDRNGGAYLARNAGMRHATGEYVTVHDADDWSHPQKIATQLSRLREAPDAIGVMACWLRVRPDLFAIGYWRLAEQLISENQSSFLFPRQVLDEIGYWDAVRAGADNEFIWRFRTRFGDGAIAETGRDLPLSLSLVRPDSLTRQGPTHVRTVYHGVRKDYHRIYRRWHRSLSPGDLALPDAGRGTRGFPAPHTILPDNRDVRRFDQVFISDFSDDAHAIDMAVDCVTRAAEAGGNVGLFHWPDYETVSDLAFAPPIAGLLDGFRIRQISAWETVASERLVLCDPFLARHAIEGIPDFGAKRLEVLCRTAGAPDWQFDPRHRRLPTREELEGLFGIPCDWKHAGP